MNVLLWFKASLFYYSPLLYNLFVPEEDVLIARLPDYSVINVSSIRRRYASSGSLPPISGSALLALR